MSADQPAAGPRRSSALTWRAGVQVFLAPAMAAAALLAASLLWHLPLLYSVLASVLVFAAALLRLPQAVAPNGASDTALTEADLVPSIAALVEALPDAAFLLDQTGDIVSANPLAAERFPAARTGISFRMAFRQPEMASALDEALHGARRVVALSEADPARSYAVTFSPLRWSGNPRMLVTLEDVSDRLAVDRMRTDFVANASHELRTPLASLTGFIETLLGPARADPQATERFLRIMHDQARRMSRLLDDLLSLGRLETRARQRPENSVDLDFVLRHVADALAPLAEENGVAIVMSRTAAKIEVTGDRDELVQVFQNLIENAIRYGAAGGKVEVESVSEPGGVVVHVRDYGPGIAEEHLPRLTERFYRVDVGSSRAMKGTGLGLAIVKHILVRHGGRLEIASRLGEGARFSVHLPLRARDAKA